MKHLLQASALSLAISLCGTAGALAAGALKGKTYVGKIAQREAAITLKVARNGRTVRVSVPQLPAYCQSGGPPEVQITEPVPIRHGRFTAKIVYEYHGHKSYQATISGQFKGHGAAGTVRSEFGPHAGSCNGSSSFAATAG